MNTTTVPVRRFPTRLHVRCGKCQHQAFITIFISKPPRLRCTKCGSRSAIIVSRDKTERWSARRGAAGKGATLH